MRNGHGGLAFGRTAKGSIKAVLKSLGVGITRYSTLEKLRSLESGQGDIEFLRAMYPDATPTALAYLHKSLECIPASQSQYRQDLFVLSQLGFKSGGFFVEFGATDGIHLSNTYLLEKEFDWTGILAEPADCWLDDLKHNRTAQIDTRCVWRESGVKLSFNEVDKGGLSTISEFAGTDLHGDARKHGRQYLVETISLLDLLDQHAAPRDIDFLSIDTEGSEFDILDNFDFSRYRFRVITCEHNYTPARDKIFELLTSNGYTRVFEEVSFNDDWYVSSARDV